MTTDDRILLNDLNRLGDALGPFAGGILTDSLSVTAQLDFGYRLISVASRIRMRVEQERTDSRRQTVDGDAL
ncbi:MAG: hypothetical protein ACRDSP_16500 [Pseudonocardiaceae bacterium]